MFLLSLLLAPALLCLSVAQGTFQCPISDIAITQCRGEKDCVYPNPGSCNTYIQCSLGSDFLPVAPAIKNCLPGHEWNDKDKKCDVPEKSTCPVYANTKTPVVDDVVGVSGSRRARQIMRCLSGFEWDGKTKSCHLADAVTPIIDEVENVVEDPTMRCPPGFELVDNECRRVSYANARSPVIDEVEGVVDHAEKRIRREADSPNTLEEVIGDSTSGIEEVAIQHLQVPEKKRAGRANAQTIMRLPIDFECPVEDIAKTKCKSRGDCQYPDPEGCGSFINCVVNSDGRTGTAYRVDCPQGLRWNDNVKVCDWPQSSTCPIETLEEALSEDGENDDNDDDDDDDDDNDNDEDNGRSHFVCPAEDIAKTKCKGPYDCTYPHPDSCGHFIKCVINDDGLTGTPYSNPCQSGLEWNDNFKVCTWPRDSTCPTETLKEVMRGSASGAEEPVIQYLPVPEKRRAGRRMTVEIKIRIDGNDNDNGDGDNNNKEWFMSDRRHREN